MTTPPVQPLQPSALYRRCDPDNFDFETTADLEDLDEVIGQERAVSAIDFGIRIEQKGFNLFALGPNGTGKYTSTHRSLKQKAGREPVPDDWCYVYNFSQAHVPRALRLPAGRGTAFEQDMKKLVEELFAVIPSAFEGDDYHNQKRAIEAEFQERQEVTLEALRHEAEKQNITLIRTPAGLAFAPVLDGEVIKPDEFMKLPLEIRQQIENQIKELQERLQRIIRQVPQWIREGQARVKALNEEVASFAIKPLIDELKEKYADLLAVLKHIDAVQQDIIENNSLFVDMEEDSPPAEPAEQQSPEAFAGRYRVNVIIDNGTTEGAPVIYEQNPTYQNLIGRVEHLSHMGTLITSFSMIKAGALHRANGGYLLLDVRKLLLQPYAWEGLKQALRSEEIQIESPGQALGLLSTASLEPKAIPLEVKVVLLGDPMLYYLLHEHDPDFSELFKVTADFEIRMGRNEENEHAYARLVSTLVRKEALRHFDRPAIARLIEQSSRLADDAERLSTHMQSIADLIRESNYWAGQTGADIIAREHVQQAIDAQKYRAGRVEERLKEMILREMVLIDTKGEKIGQINGLSVLSMGTHAFGRPSRITARVRLGKGEIIDIERQVELGGPLHTKGVLILAGYLGARYAADRPLSLSASIVFEQSYGGVDGDSASSPELYALLSALAQAPVKQSLAVTGSVNQHGQIQAIGGANEKIEGFFDICQARGLTGEQGVLLPASNVKNLMLRHDVVEAAADGRFHIYPIETIEQGIELLTGLPAGEPDEEGHYPEGSINRRIIDRLEEMAKKARALNRPEGKDE